MRIDGKYMDDLIDLSRSLAVLARLTEEVIDLPKSAFHFYSYHSQDTYTAFTRFDCPFAPCHTSMKRSSCIDTFGIGSEIACRGETSEE